RLSDRRRLHRGGGGTGFRLDVSARRSGRLPIDRKFQSEWHRGVHKRFYGFERDVEAFRDAIKGKPDIEMILLNREIPELVLEHDGHVVRVARPKTRRYAHAVNASIESDKKMVIPLKRRTRHIGEHSPNDATKRILGQKVVADVVDRHGRLSSVLQRPPTLPSPLAGEDRVGGSGGFCCQVPPNPA